MAEIHVVRTDTSTNPVCTCDHYPGAFDVEGKPAKHERGCAYHYPTAVEQWEAYKAEPQLQRDLAAARAEAARLKAALEQLASLTSNTDDMRIIARVLGGTEPAAERYIALADKIDEAIAQARAALEPAP